MVESCFSDGKSDCIDGIRHLPLNLVFNFNQHNEISELFIILLI